VTDPNGTSPRAFLFLQGPTNYLFAEVARQLRAQGHRAFRINLCLGDQIFWRGPGVTSFRGRFDDWPGFLSCFYTDHAITDVVLLGEQRLYHQVAIELAHTRGIDVAVTDFGYLRPDWVILERDGLNARSRFTRDPAALLQEASALPAIGRSVRYPHHALNQALWDMTFHLSSALWPWGYPHYRRHTLRHPVLTYLATGWRLSRGVIEKRQAAATLRRLAAAAGYYLFAMQMEDDYSLRAYSHYADLDQAMAEVMHSFAGHARPDAALLFKIHPLDPGFKAWRRRIDTMARAVGIAERVLFIDGGDLDALILASNGVLTVNSTAGLRSLELLRPTLALGQAIYRVDGLAFNGPLDAFWSQAKAPDAALVDAWLRLLAASLHVRGGMYDQAAINAAASGIAWRLHYRQVNQPLRQVLLGEPLRIPGAAE